MVAKLLLKEKEKEIKEECAAAIEKVIDCVGPSTLNISCLHGMLT